MEGEGSVLKTSFLLLISCFGNSQGTIRVTTGESSYLTSKNDDNQSDSNAVEKSYQSKTTIRRTGQGGYQNIINCTILTRVKLATIEPLLKFISTSLRRAYYY